MNRSRRPFLATLAAFVLSVGLGDGALAQTPLTLTWKTKMKFGKVAADDTAGGTVILSPNGNTTNITGNLTNFGGTIKRGKLEILGDPKAYVIVTLPSSFTMRKGTSVHTVTVTNVTMNQTNPVRLNKTGKKNIFFGGTLTVASNQWNGTYDDDIQGFVIDVEYQ